jgi:hypothetical protein
MHTRHRQASSEVVYELTKATWRAAGRPVCRLAAGAGLNWRSAAAGAIEWPRSLGHPCGTLATVRGLVYFP